MDERKILYQQFLKDKKTYNLNVGFWRVKLQKALNENISSKEQLFENKTEKGKSYYDGNPMFSYYNLNKDKAIRLIQEDPSYLETHIDIKLIEAWVNTILISNFNREEREIPELVISLFLTSSTVDNCVQLAKEWFDGTLTKSNLKDRLSNLLTSSQKTGLL